MDASSEERATTESPYGHNVWISTRLAQEIVKQRRSGRRDRDAEGWRSGRRDRDADGRKTNDVTGMRRRKE